MSSRTSTEYVSTSRRYPIGVEVIQSGQHSGRVHARVWAKDCRSIELVTDGESSSIALSSEGNEYHSGYVDNAGVGSLYRFWLDGKDAFPDPASRYQPD